jgi:hypothetical protein
MSDAFVGLLPILQKRMVKNARLIRYYSVRVHKNFHSVRSSPEIFNTCLHDKESNYVFQHCK